MTDVAVVGAGITGLCTAHALRSRGASVTLYERGVPGNGQSGGEARIFRHAHEDPRLIELAKRSLAGWRALEAHFGVELVSRDGVLSVGPATAARLEALRSAGVRVREVAPAEVLPLVEPLSFPGPALLDEDAGAIRVRAAIERLSEGLADVTVSDEVVAVRDGEVRAGGSAAAFDRVVVCAGRGTRPLALGAGIDIPVEEATHVRLTFAVREPPERLPCLLDGVYGAYADPYPGNDRYALGLNDTGPAGLAGEQERIVEHVERHLPGLDRRPVDVRHCWVTALPWGHDALAVYEAGRTLFLAGNNLFKHAPALGEALAHAALTGELDPQLRPDSHLGERR